MPLPDRYAYQITLPTGRVARIAGKRHLTHAVLRRIDDTWTVHWCSSRRRAHLQERDLRNFLLHRSGIAGHRHEVITVPVQQTPLPTRRWVAATLPNGTRTRDFFYPEWDEPQPTAVIAVANGEGWKAAAWVTSDQMAAREAARLKATNDQVAICPAHIEQRKTA